jgi:pimeloyl-ACP methyl ester carboxylesterase
VALRMLRPAARTREAFIDDHVQTYRLIGSREFDFEEQHKRERPGRLFDRGIHPAGSARQLAAVVTAEDRTEALRQIRVPTAVIHGDQDPLVNVSGARATAQAIPDTELVILPAVQSTRQPRSSAYRCHSPGTPLSSAGPRSWN